MSVKPFIPLACVAALVSGCGGRSAPRPAPDLRGERLDVAERRLDDLGLEFERVGGGAFGIVVRSNWEVCRQEPAPGVKTRKLRLVVDRSCPAPPPVLHVAPDLVGRKLGVAEGRLESLNLTYSVESLDFASPAPSLSSVCDQSPAAGTRTSHVMLFTARDCSSLAPPSSPPEVPDVRGLALDLATQALNAQAIAWDIVPSGPGPVVDELWEVCSQSPRPRSRAWHVTLYARDDC
jgi:PASTA domain-containing protein